MAAVIAGVGQTPASFLVAGAFLFPLLLTGYRAFHPRTIITLSESKLWVYDFRARNPIELPRAVVKSALIESSFRPDGEGWGSVRVLRILMTGKTLAIVLPMLGLSVETANARLAEWGRRAEGDDGRAEDVIP